MTTSLLLDSGKIKRELIRERKGEFQVSNKEYKGYKITIKDGLNEEKDYYIWKKTIEIATAPKEFQDSVKALKGKWPDLEKADCMLAVGVSQTPEAGLFSIFLPTEMATGCYAHINATFYGEMARKTVDFHNTYNSWLLQMAAQMAFDVIHQELTNMGKHGARAITDILTPISDNDAAGKRWLNLIKEKASLINVDLSEANIFLSDKGWTTLAETNLVPSIESPVYMTETVLRKHSNFNVFHSCLKTREPLLERLFEIFEIECWPCDDDMACTVESIALDLHKRRRGGKKINWNGFWSDAIELFNQFDRGSIPLGDKKVLLGHDNDLHASSQDCVVFFPPGQGPEDDEETPNKSVLSIPKSLNKYVAFLNEEIQVYDARKRTPLYDFLDTLVKQFRVKDIITSVLIPKIPKLPLAHGSSEEQLCVDILYWGFNMISGLLEKGKGDTTVGLLKSFPVPCQGGWYQLQDATFGRNWPDTIGANINNYLSTAGTDLCREEKKTTSVTTFPCFMEQKGAEFRSLLEKAGVANYIRLINIEPSQWKSAFTGYYFSLLKNNVPPGILKSTWDSWVQETGKAIKFQYNSHNYEIQTLYTIPGVDNYDSFNDSTRYSFMKIVLGSITKWRATWRNIDIIKKYGRSDSNWPISPLAYVLQSLAWVGSEQGNGAEWSRLSEKWYIPRIFPSSRYRYAHLRLLPNEITQKLDENAELVNSLVALGMPKFDFDNDTKFKGTRLLDDLAEALDRDIAEFDFNLILPHVRKAWSVFSPGKNDSFPKRVIIRCGTGPLIAKIPSSESPVYIPDSSGATIEALDQFSLPIVTILPSDAKNLSAGFSKYYGNGIQLASEIKRIPIVNKKPGEATSALPLFNSEMKWLIPLVLTLVAFYGDNARGTNSKPFFKCLEIFREVKIWWASSLEAALLKGTTTILEHTVPAMWIPADKLLFISEDCKKDLSQLSEAISSIIQREDLESAIKLVLKEIKDIEPNKDEIVNALKIRHIDENQFSEVFTQWQGDIGYLIRMISPVVSILKQGINFDILNTLTTEDSIVDFLNQQCFPGLNGRQIVAYARSASSLYELGFSFFKKYGQDFQLDRWNNILKTLQESPIVNENAKIEFEGHIASVRQPLNALIVHILSRDSSIGLFKEMAEKISSLTCPLDYENNYWEIEFEQAMRELVPIFKAWGTSKAEIDAICLSKSNEDLIIILDKQGVNTDFDPLSVFSDNHDKLKSAFKSYQNAAICWCIRQKGMDPSYWISEEESIMAVLSRNLEKDGFINNLSDIQVFTLLKQLPHYDTYAVFWQHVDKSQDVDELIQSLGITRKDLEDAKKTMSEYKEKRRRDRRIEVVCGGDFDNTEDNLTNLWNHIRAQIDDSVVSSLDSINLGNPASLKQLTDPKRKVRPPGEPPRTKPGKRPSKQVRELVGLTGEIHVFRRLQQEYGTSIVDQSNWISGNCNYVFPDQKTDDGYGCDFVINLGKTVYYIEAKASQESDQTFELTSSEIDLARRLAGNKKRNREIFCILHVTNALSQEPVFQLLPNPYDNKMRDYFIFNEANTRVKYKL